MSDATQESVSGEAEAKASKQNAAVAAVEAETGAQVSTETAAPGGDITPEPEKKEKPEPVENPREAKRAAIAKKREQQRDEPGTEPEIPPETMGIPDDLASQPGRGGTVTLNVNGKDKEVPAEKVLDVGKRALQKEYAADAKLETASKKMSELDAREQRIAQREQELQAASLEASGKSTPPSTEGVSVESDIDPEEIVDDLYSGDKTKAVKAVEKLRGAAATDSPQTVDPNEVATIVEQRQEARSTLQRFYGRYPGIAADKNLQSIVNSESLRIAREHPEYSKEQLLMESGKFVAEKYGSKIVDDTGFQDKANRKSHTDTVTGADVTRRPQPEQQPTSRRQVVADMKAGRR